VPLSDGRITQARLSPVGTSYGEQIGWAAVFRDISVLKELEQMKNDFVNTVSHDLKNPISSILLAADLLKRLGPLENTQVQMHGRIVETANYMNELVSDLLDLGRISAGLDMDKDPVDMVQLIGSVLESLNVQVEEKEHEIILSMPGSAIIQGDMGRLKQVLLNLIGNAIKYTPERGEIIVSVTLAGSDGRGSDIQPDKDLVEAGVADEESLVVVRVQDNGYGIPSADVPHVFDRFFRVQSDETFDIKGTGLGLAIAKSIIEAHDGRIWVDSEEGKGSTFAFYIPH
jgi:signal transduction histidine kinase